MTSVNHDNAMSFEQMPKDEDGYVDLRSLGLGLIEQAVNTAMQMQADELVGETNRRNGYRERDLKTPFGVLHLRIPKLRTESYFPDQLLRPYSRTDRAMVGVVAKAYQEGLSTRRIEKIAAKLEYGSLSPATVSRMLASLDEDVEALRTEPLDGPLPYLWLDATYVHCRVEGHVVSQAAVTAIGAGMDGKRRYVGFGVVDTESYESWRGFLRSLRARGVRGVRLVVSDAHAGLCRAIGEVFQSASWQRCIVHLERDVLGRMRTRRDKARAAAALRAVFAQDEPAMVHAAYDNAVDTIGSIERRAGELLDDAREDALAYLAFPHEHRVRVRTNNVQERANREIKRRTDSVQVFPSTASMIRLVGAVLADMNEEWAVRRFMDASGMRDLSRDTVLDMIPTDEQRELAARIILTALEQGA